MTCSVVGFRVLGFGDQAFWWLSKIRASGVRSHGMIAESSAEFLGPAMKIFATRRSMRRADALNPADPKPYTPSCRTVKGETTWEGREECIEGFMGREGRVYGGV